jgi:hypothetical protein
MKANSAVSAISAAQAGLDFTGIRSGKSLAND